MSIDQMYLKTIVNYDKNTGEFTSSVVRGGKRKVIPGQKLGSLSTKGYVQITIDGRSYGAHRLAWLYCFGFIPKGQIDHINGNRSDNRIENLRECSQSENNENLSNDSDRSSSCIVGVCYAPSRNRWIAYVKKNGKQVMRICMTKEDAIEKRKQLKRELHKFNPIARCEESGAK